jgi:anti-sigma B factor antagonist
VAYNLPIMAEPFEVEHLFGAREGHGILCLKGPLTAENQASLQNAVRRENADTIILDLAEVPYVDSAGLGSLVSACISRQKAGQRVALSGVNERVLKLFQITRVEPLFLMFPTLEDALDGLSSAGHA